MSEQVDVLVIGGGPVGAALARALSGHPVSMIVLEAKTSPGPDPRVLALSHGSRLFLERIGAWQNVRRATPINTIHVSQKGGFGRAVLRAEESGVPSLGHVAGYGEIHDALVEGLSPEIYVEGATAREIDLSRGTVDFDYLGERRQVCARLIVMAEGGRLVEQVKGIEVHRKDYGQWAVIGQVKTDRPHGNIAYERFTKEGPVALLPFGDGFSLVWTATPDYARSLVEMERGEFLQRLQDHFGSRAGRFVDCDKRSGFPLALRYCEPIVAERLALVGNAAQTLHPVSGQGLNLGLRDVAALSRSILDCPIDEIGHPGMLSAHAKSRRTDREGGIRFTDSLIRIFSNEIPLLDSGRGLGLAALDCLPPARKWFSRKMMFGLRPGRIL